MKPQDAPKTYADLLDPKWKGKIAWTNDLDAAGPPGFIHNILTIMGDEKGMAYLQRVRRTGAGVRSRPHNASCSTR